MDSISDPRITGEHVRRVPAEPNGLTLVGVVHDHPASTYRVIRVIESLDPEVVALELPETAVPLFEAYARSGRSPPVFGGEMSAAIQASDAETVGVDRPTAAYTWRLAKRLCRLRPPTATLRRVLSNTAAAITHAFVCRFAGVVAARTGVRLEVDSPVPHDVDRWDAPVDQARDERDQVRRSTAFMRAFQSASETRASRFEDETREAHMADRLASLRDRGSVVAVVGIEHLDPLAERLDATTG